jgi:hypothetical protein
VRTLAAAATAVLLTGAVAALTRFPVTFPGGGAGVLRLSWHLRGVTAESCRTVSDEDLARLPPHMRNPRACIGVSAAYHLTVTTDGTPVVDDTVRAPGARGDRPLNVLRELPLEPGDHRIEIRFRALVPDGAASSDEGTAEVTWNGRIRVQAREVALVTLDATGKELELRSRTESEGVR